MPYFHEIQRIVCSGERISFTENYKELQTKTRKREIVLARQMVMYFLKLINGSSISWEKVGSFYGKDHATAMHASKAVKNLIDTDRNVAARITLYELQIKAVINFERNLVVDNLEVTKSRIKQMIDDGIPITYEMVSVYNSLLEKSINIR